MRFIFFLFSFFVFISCSDDQSSSKKAETTAVMIFVDKTSSVDLNDNYVGDKYRTALKQVIQEDIQNTGDELEMYYIHENTAKSRCLKLQSRAELEDTYGMNATDLEAANTTFEMMLNKEKNIFTNKALDKMNAANSGESNKETDVLSAISKISEKCQEYDQVKVYFFSDMIESTKRGRDFHKNPPKSSSEAEKMAKEDLKPFADSYLSNAEVSVLLPFAPTSSSSINNPSISAYWQSIFQELGANYEEI